MVTTCLGSELTRMNTFYIYIYFSYHVIGFVTINQHYPCYRYKTPHCDVTYNWYVTIMCVG